jgi:hypothetical protein
MTMFHMENFMRKLLQCWLQKHEFGRMKLYCFLPAVVTQLVEQLTNDPRAEGSSHGWQREKEKKIEHFLNF